MSLRAGSLRETITLFTRTESGPPDRYGNPTMVESAGVAVAAAVAPVGAAGGVGSSMELEMNRDTRINRYVFTVLPETNLDALSRIAWRNRSFEVIGEPRTFTVGGNVHHKEVTGEERLG